MSDIDSGPSAIERIAAQRDHWDATFAANPQMFGTEPSDPGQFTANRLRAEGLARVLELGAGQGRDTLAFLDAGLEVSALDYAATSLSDLVGAAAAISRSTRLTTLVHDVRDPLPFPDASFDACYSHMLLTMALSSDELASLAAEVRRILRPGGLCIYTVRHTGDAHFGAGIALGDGLYENGGFVVHFFDRALVERLADGFELEDVTDFEEGSLPRRLWRVTMRRR